MSGNLTDRVLVTGASGTVGRELVRMLVAAGALVRAGHHRRDDLVPEEDLEVDRVFVDFDDPRSLRDAMGDIEVVYLLTPQVPQAVAQVRAAVAAARTCGVRRIVRQSMFPAATGSDSLSRWHREAEAVVARSGLASTTLRPTSFMQNFVTLYGPSIRDEDRFHLPLGAAAQSSVDARDVAAAATAVLMDEVDDAVYTLTGPAALTGPEMAAVLSEAAGRAIAWVDEPEDAGRPPRDDTERQVDRALREFAGEMRAGRLAVLTDDVERLTGRPATTFAQFARDYAWAFAPRDRAYRRGPARTRARAIDDEKGTADMTELAKAAGTIRIGGNLTVTRLGFGAMRITGPGIMGDPPDREEARRVLRRAIGLGVDFIDTADSYGPRVSEELIAETLHPYPAGLVIATKGGLLRPGPGEWTPDGRPEHLRAALEGSLRTLRLERIDLYQLHRPDPRVPYEESVGALAELQREGKIRHIGVSNVGRDELERARRVATIVSVQNRYNPLERDDDPLIDLCEREGIAFLPWAPVGQGRIGHRVLDAVARRNGVTPYQVVIAWLLARSPAVLPIPGTGSVVHLEQNVAAARVRLSPADLAAIDDLEAKAA